MVDQREALLELQAQTWERVQNLEAKLSALTTARRSSSDDDEHDPEGETLSSQWSMLSGLLESAREDEQRVDEAIRRLDAGGYGICTECQQPIPAAQLEIRPFRERCVACAS